MKLQKWAEMKEPEIKKLQKQFFEHQETPAWDRFASALRKAYNLPEKQGNENPNPRIGQKDEPTR